MSKNAAIISALRNGDSVRKICGSLHVAPSRVIAVRAQYPDLFKPEPKKSIPGSVRAERVPSVSIAVRVPGEIYKRFIADITARRLKISDFINSYLSERYGYRLNEYIIQDDCDCYGRIIKNINSNLDRDQFICDRCGMVREVSGGGMGPIKKALRHTQKTDIFLEITDEQNEDL